MPSAISQTLRCSICQVEQGVESFHKRAASRQGYDSRCKGCRAQSAKTKYWKDPTARREYNRMNTRRWRLRQYGITEEDLLAMLDAQESSCASCATSISMETLVVDHNHADGAVRGLLCNNCNVGIGMFGDDVNRMTNAITYLLRTSTYSGMSMSCTER